MRRRDGTTTSGDEGGMTSVAGAAALLGVSEKTVRRRIASGALRAHRVGAGGPVRLWAKDVLALLVPATTKHE